MGYHDAVYNLFRDYYAALAARRDGRAHEVTFPDFHTGHEEMRIIDAAVESSKSGHWVKVQA
jgi:predicted dehydrogenase